MQRIEITADLVRGAAGLETTARGVRPHRLPAWVRRQLPDPQLLSVESQPSAVRLVLGTRATRIELTTHPMRTTFRGIDRPRGSIDVRVDGALHLRDTLTGGDLDEVDLTTGRAERVPGPPHVTVVEGLGAHEKRVEIWLPHNETVDLVRLAADAGARPVPPDGPVWVHHGSSISQGSNAVAPSATWPAVAARRLRLDLRNLGLGGSALVDQALARVIRDSPADVISLKLGINVVNLDGMRARTLLAAVHGFLDTVRDGHPTTPLLLVSPVHCGTHEDTPGPGALDPAALAEGRMGFVATGTPGDTATGRLTLRVVRDVLAQVVATRSDDPHLHHLDGTRLYGEADAVGLPLPDGLHPDTATHELIGERFADHVLSGARPFAPVLDEGSRPSPAPA